jgi:FkbM family methyltransferase
MNYKKFLCIGHPRCGTTSISYYLNQMGYKVGHEKMDDDGVSSWMLAVRDNSYPYGNVKTLENHVFENIIHIVRNPFDAISSIILENKYTPNNLSYKFKIKHIKKILDINMPNIDFNNITLREEIEIAIQTFLYWNRICELNNPTLICKIEDIKPIQIFNTSNININTTSKNSNKFYDGKKYDKPVLEARHYSKINKDLLKELECFCKKYNYLYSLDSENIYNIHNYKMYIPPSNTDGIFISLRTNNIWEKAVTKSLIYKINELNINSFIDVGANIGYYSLLFSMKNINTYAFEPNNTNYKILQKNITLNNIGCCTLYNFGLGEKEEKLSFYYRNEKSGHGTFYNNIKEQQNLNLSDTIDVKTLDSIDIVGDNIAIKIDVEGFELSVLKGMNNLLESNRIKLLCIEISRKFYGRLIEKEIINLLKSYFTRLYIVQTKSLYTNNIPEINQYDLVCS